MHSKCRTKAHLSFLGKLGIFQNLVILPSSVHEKIPNDVDKSSNIKELIPTELLHEPATADTILGL